MSEFRSRLMALAAALVVAAAFPNAALAQATRTWVSGVGDDANPCSRTAPCKTFAGAISKTAPAGEIDVLDPGGFGGVTITKSISIEAVGVVAGVLVSGTNAIVISAGPSDVVVLRGLTIDGLGTGLAGVKFLAGGALHVEDCTINNFTTTGVDFEPNSDAQLFIKDTIVRDNAGGATNQSGGILVKPSAGTVRAALDNVRIEKNTDGGVRAEGTNTHVTINRSVISGNTNSGIIGVLGAKVFVSDSASVNNVNGVKADVAGTVVTISNVTITNNTGQGVFPNGGTITSFGNNHVSGNVVDGVPTLPVVNPM